MPIFSDKTFFVTETCCNCSMPFAMTEDFQKARRQDRKTFYCPAGHGQRYVGKTEEQKLKDVLKSMGLKAGEKVEQLGLIEVISTRIEPLNHITQDDVIREGFPTWTPAQFVEFYVNKNRCAPDLPVNRIEYRYIE